MPLEEELDYTGYDADKVERGDSVPAGWYHVMVEDVYEDRKGSGAIVFEYQIIDGQCKGSKLFDRLMEPSLAENANAERFALNRKRLVAKRLGLVSEFGAPQPVSWVDAIGKEYWVQTKERSYDDKKTGEKKTTTGIDYAGIYPLDDPRVPPEVLAGEQQPPSPFDGQEPDQSAVTQPKPGTPPGKPPATSGRRPTAPKQQNLDDISV